MFQSTPPREGRPDTQIAIRRREPVSIHAPARGATSYPVRKAAVRLGFNPRPRERGDWAITSDCSSAQSFNPRPRERGDASSRVASGRRQPVSIHAPARGATGPSFCSCRLAIVSIHAPARGATLSHGQKRHRQNVSIHAPARGATDWRRRSTSCLIRFNPRPRERGDHFPTHLHPITAGVSIHAPARGATPCPAISV